MVGAFERRCLIPCTERIFITAAGCDLVATRRYAEGTIDSAVVSLDPGKIIGAPVVRNQLHLLLNERPAIPVKNLSSDHAAAQQLEVEVFNRFAFADDQSLVNADVVRKHKRGRGDIQDVRSRGYVRYAVLSVHISRDAMY